MELFMGIFSGLQYGIAFLAAVWLLANALKPKVAALRSWCVAKSARMKQTVSDASVSAAPSAERWSAVELE